MSGAAEGTTGAPGVTQIRDGASANLATVAPFHSMDNQSPGGSANGLLTGGVAQLLNPVGNLDRQRETSFDSVAGVGIAMGTQQLALPYSPVPTSGAATIAAGANRVVTPSAMTGTSRGTPWAIQIGTELLVDTGASGVQEKVCVTAVTATTFTATFANAHAANVPVLGFVYTQARDSSVPDGTALTGVPLTMTGLLNSALNAGVGGIEQERSAAGELDGASGTGTAVAAEYEYNSGGPPLSTGFGSLLQFDRGRNINGKGLAVATITPPAPAAITIVVPTPSQVNALQPGSPLYLLTGGAITEVCYVAATYVPGTSPVALQNPVVTGGETTAAFDVFSASGPGLNGFVPTGIEISEEALWDPVSSRFYIERSATQDAMPAANIVAEAGVFWNPAANGFERERTPTVWRSMNAVASGAAIWTPAAGKRVRIMGFILQCAAAGNIVLTDTATNPNTPLVVPVGGPNTPPTGLPDCENGWLSGAANNTIVATAPGTISGTIFGTEE